MAGRAVSKYKSKSKSKSKSKLSGCRMPYRASGRLNGQSLAPYRKAEASERSGYKWGKITIISGAANYRTDYLLDTLHDAAPVAFHPINRHAQGKHFVFYVKDAAAAAALSDLNEKISAYDGCPIIIMVKESSSPFITVDEDLRCRISGVMRRRYNYATKTLDLSKFHLDEELCSQYYIPLSYGNILKTVVEIILKEVPDVNAIDASGNKIFSIETLKELSTRARSLTSLNLSGNKISNIDDIGDLVGLPLQELVLTRNLLGMTQSCYTKAVRKHFPNLLKLDGEQLTPRLTTEAPLVSRADESQSTDSHENVSDASELEGGSVVAFLEQYFCTFDSDDRQPLLNVYHNSVTMCFTCSDPPGTPLSDTLKCCTKESDGNHSKRENDPSRLLPILHEGKDDVFNFISKLPKTWHDPSASTVTISFATDHLIMASVTGYYHEREEDHSAVRWFQRLFVMILSNESYLVVNEQFHVSSDTAKQSQVLEPNITCRLKMIRSFSERSGMNKEWAYKCLEENKWNFQRAAYIFAGCMKNNSIPPEAFVQSEK